MPPGRWTRLACQTALALALAAVTMLVVIGLVALFSAS